MSGIDHFIKTEYRVDDVRCLSYTDKWQLFQRITWDLKNMDLDYDVYKQAESDIKEYLEL